MNNEDIKNNDKRYILNELFFYSAALHSTIFPITSYNNYIDLINEIFNDGLIFLPHRIKNISNHIYEYYETGIDYSITEEGLKLINTDEIIAKINQSLMHFPKRRADQIQHLNSHTLGYCEENEINALILYFLIKSLAINKFCVISKFSTTFETKSGLNIIDCEVYYYKSNTSFYQDLLKILNKYSKRQIGLAKERLGTKNKFGLFNWRDITIYFIEYYLCEQKIVEENDFQGIIDSFLFGNGLSIGLCGFQYFENNVLVTEFLKILNPYEYKKIQDLIGYMNFFMFEYLKDQDKEDFFNSYRRNEKINKLNISIDNTNTYLSLFSRFSKEINLKNIGIEDFQLFEIIYHETIEDTKKPINSINYYIDYPKYFCNIITKAQNFYLGNKQLIAEHFKNTVIFTTNYDNIIEKNLPENQIIHLHGNVKNNSIVTGAKYHNKVGKIINMTPYINCSQMLENKDFYILSKIKGTLGILGYSGNNNDEHIHAIIRQNPNINTIVYYCFDKKIDAIEKRRLVNFFTDFSDNKIVKIVNADDFYKKYCKIE